MKEPICVFWFRRDLRLNDNRGLFEALSSGLPVLPIFIFDSQILQNLPEDDARVHFIYECLTKISDALLKLTNSNLAIYHGTPEEIFTDILKTHNVREVFINADYEPYALNRDQGIGKLLQNQNIKFRSFKDHVYFEKDEIVKEDGAPYVVYTPYMKKWKATFRMLPGIPHYDSYGLLKQFKCVKSDHENPNLENLGFKASSIKVPHYSISECLIEEYEATRNFPALDGTSRLGPHLRFGTISVRDAVQHAVTSKNETFWNELIWREFFIQILWHFPHTTKSAFKKAYDRIAWRNDMNDFEKWKSGKTGFALVDAGMRELQATGYMHNRVRMLTASFLCKHLLIDWRLGEAYFAEKLLDFELASNVGNWQWAAGSGVDAAPYFRIFNPQTQILKFDKALQYIRKWIPEYETFDYPKPIVDHKFARERCLSTYKSGLQ
ncbi:MAG: hypothetical protein RLZZ241_1806 [Bacteroidota bacterium]